MLEKRKIPVWVYLILLTVILAAAYYLSGIFCFPDLSILNVKEYLGIILRHPFDSWWNEKTPACLCAGGLVWIMIVGYIQNHYRNFHSGVEYGTEEWANVNAVNREMRDPDPSKNRILSRNLSITLDGKNGLSNNNMLVIGSSGTYKTTSVVVPNLLKASGNYIVLDVKGELLYQYGNYLKSRGYTIRCLNLKEPERSDRYNPYAYVEREEDIIRLIASIQDALTPPDAAKGDPFWQDGACLYLQAIFFYEWEVAREEHRMGNMNNIMQLINDETTVVPDGEDEGGKITVLQMKMDRMEAKYGPDHPAVRDYRKLKRGAEETVRSIIIIVNAMLKLFETEGIRKIFSGDDLGLREFATGVGGTVSKPTQEKLALFLCVPDNDKSYNFLCSMLYTQALDLLMRMADTDFRDRGASLPIPVEIWMDEFYAGARPYAVDSLMGVVRSRNISLIPILQSVAQLKSLYPGDKWQILMDNCAVLLYLGSGSGALETHKYISDLAGDMTIDTANDGRSGQNGSVNYGRMARKLLTANEVRRLNRKQCIIFLEGQLPIRDRKALPWEMPEGEVPFKKAMAMNRKGGYVHPLMDQKEQEKASGVRKPEPPLVLEFLDRRDSSGMGIRISEDEFLRLNLHPEDKNKPEAEPVPTVGTERPLEEVILAFSQKAAHGEMDQILNALEQGKPEEEIRSLIHEMTQKTEDENRSGFPVGNDS